MSAYTYYDYLENYYESHYYYYYYYLNGTYNGTYPWNSTYNGTFQYHAPFDMDIINPPVFGVSLLCFLLAVSITTYFFYKLYTHNPKAEGEALPQTLVLIVSWVVVLHLAVNTVDPLGYYAWYINFDRHSTIRWDTEIAWDILWCLSKVSIYILFVYRYYLVFTAASNSTETVKHIIFGTYSLVISIQVILITLYMISYYQFEEGHYGTWQDAKDAKRLYLNYCWMFMFIDAGLIGSLSYLLIHLIMKLVIDIDRSHLSESKPRFHSVRDQSMQSSTQKSKSKSGKELVPVTNPIHTGTPQSEDNLSDMVLDIGTNTHLSDLILHDANDYDITIDDVIGIELSSQPPMTMVNSISLASPTNVVEIKKNSKAKTKAKRKNTRNKIQMKLLHTVTRISITCVIALTSSFIFFAIWLVYEETEYTHEISNTLHWVSETWCIDSVINLACVYLSMGLAKREYNWICKGLCKCHQCCLRCIIRRVDSKSKEK